MSTERSTCKSTYYRTIAKLGAKIAAALDYAHERGIVHRDVKPGNVLLDASGECWVTDFGLAHVESDATLTRTGELVGTLRYMAPEQVRGERGLVDSRADIYGLGLTLYELLTLRAPFSSDDRPQLIRAILEDHLPAPRRVDPAIPRDLETIVLKASAKDLQQRYRSAGELADDLNRFLNKEPLRAKRPSLLARARLWTKRHSRATATVAVTVVILFITLAALAWQRMQTRRERVLAAREDIAAADTAIVAQDYALAKKRACRSSRMEATPIALIYHPSKAGLFGAIRAFHRAG